MSVSSKKNLFGKFVNLLSGKPEDEDNTDISQDVVSLNNSIEPKEPEPIDLTFVRNFTRSDGKFIYCENKDEAFLNLSLIMQESGLSKVFNQNPGNEALLAKASVKSTSNLAEADAYCTSCEYLVSFIGGIMITAKQTLGKKLDELPETFIVIAYTSQITENLRSALTGIRNKYQGDIPSQITTIKGPKQLEDIKDPAASSSNVCNKEVYLLLLEDQD
jgi:hypothetical protein